MFLTGRRNASLGDDELHKNISLGRLESKRGTGGLVLEVLSADYVI